MNCLRCSAAILALESKSYHSASDDIIIIAESQLCTQCYIALKSSELSWSGECGKVLHVTYVIA